MTAALILEPRERTEARRLSLVKPEPQLIVAARNGDEEALSALLDMTTDSVYQFAFGATNRARAAENVTETVLSRLPRVLRRQRWDTVEAFNASLMGIARSEVAAYQRGVARRAAKVRARRQADSWTRHAVLAAASLVTIVYAGILAF